LPYQNSNAKFEESETGVAILEKPNNALLQGSMVRSLKEGPGFQTNGLLYLYEKYLFFTTFWLMYSWAEIGILLSTANSEL